MTTTLEKVRRLEKYLAVDRSATDPVLDTTIDKLLDRERKRVLSLKKRLVEQCQMYEETYTLKSGEFYDRYENGALGDDMDFIEWAATIEMLKNAEKRLTFLETDSANEPDH